MEVIGDLEQSNFVEQWGQKKMGDNWVTGHRDNSLKESYRGGEGFLGGASGKEPTCQCRRLRDTGSIPGLGRFPGEGPGNPLRYSCLENPMDRGAWWATVHSHAVRQEVT